MHADGFDPHIEFLPTFICAAHLGFVSAQTIHTATLQQHGRSWSHRTRSSQHKSLREKHDGGIQIKYE